MRAYLKKIFTFLITFAFMLAPVFAEDNIKMLVDVNSKFDLHSQNLPEEISFVVAKAETIPDIITIPEDSVVTVSIINAEVERRWHKSGIIIGKIKSYQPDGVENPIDISDRELYVIIRRYEPVNVKEAWIIGTEIVVMSGASFFAPGVDVGYFFLKGLIMKNYHPNRFVSGVHCAYENSICWFWLKGKPITLAENDLATAKGINEKKAKKLLTKVEKRNIKRELRYNKRIAKLDKKIAKRQYKNAKKEIDCLVVEQAIEAELAESL